MSKRIISIMLAGLMVLTCLPMNRLTALADETDTAIAAGSAEADITDTAIAAGNTEADITDTAGTSVPAAPSEKEADETGETEEPAAIEETVAAADSGEGKPAADLAEGTGSAAVFDDSGEGKPAADLPEETGSAAVSDAVADPSPLNGDYNPDDFNIWFDLRDGDNDLFDDEDQDLYLKIEMPEQIAEKYLAEDPEVEDLGVFLNAGVHDGDGWALMLDDETDLTFSDEWPVVNGFMKITLHGRSISQTVKDYGRVNFWAGIGVRKDGHWEWFQEAFANFNVRETIRDYEFEQDRQILKGWENDIHYQYNIHIENKDIPEGRDEPYEVTNVEIESEAPEAEGTSVLRLRKEIDDEDHPHWKYRGLSNGEAVLRVSYKDMDGSAKSYTFTVTVADDVYEIFIDTDDGRHLFLPDGTADLISYIRHWSNDPERDGDTDGLSVVWNIPDDAKDAFHLAPDGSRAKVTFSLPENTGHRDTRVEAVLMDGDKQVGYSETDLHIAHWYTALLPYRINSGMNIGDKDTYVFEEKIFSEDLTSPDRSRQVENVHFRFYYDPNAVRILDAGGQQVGNEDENGNYIDSASSTGTSCVFTIERLKEWDTWIFVDAEWNEDGEEWHDGTRYHLDGKDYNVWFETERDRIYKDETATVLLNLENLEGVDYEIGVFGIGFWNGDPGQGGEFVSLEDCCTKNDVDRGIEITLDGKKIWEKAEPYGVDEMWLHVDIGTKDGVWLSDASQNLWIREGFEDYNDREYDRSMLLHWTGMIFPFYNAYVENSEYPDGADIAYQVIDAKINWQHPWQQGKDVIRLDKTVEGGDRYWWDYEAIAYGEAEVEVTFLDIHGNEQNYTFRVFVSRDVYFVAVRTEDGSRRGLPGSQKTLIAEAFHESEDDPSTDKVTYEWILPDNAGEFAELVQDKNDPAKAVVTFRDMPEGRDHIWEDFRVECVIYDGTDNGQPIERARGDVWLTVSNDYYEIRPCEIDRWMPMWEEEEIKPELLHYWDDPDSPTSIAIENYRWYYDGRRIEILDAAGNKVGNNDENGNYIDSDLSHGKDRTFTIRRIGNEPTEITLAVDFFNYYGDRQSEECRYFLDEVEYVDPQPPLPEDPLRISGSDRYATAYAIADKLKEVLGVDQFDCAVLSTGLKFPDALAGGYLANIHSAPILLASDAPKRIPVLDDYIKKNVKAGSTLYVLGGTNTVSDTCLKGLKKDYKIRRLEGKDRYLTNIEILKEVGVKAGDPILVSTGKDYADALAASAVPMPILLVSAKLNDEQIKYLNTLKGSEFYILGSEKAVSKDVANALKTYGKVVRIAGDDRYKTSVAVAEYFYKVPQGIAVTYGRDFPDGLCGGVLAYRMACPLILANTVERTYKPGADYARKNNLSSGFIYGGTNRIDDTTALKIFCGAKKVTEFTR